MWPAAIRFHRDDYPPIGSPSVQGAVVEAVAAPGGSVRGPVAMLGHVRTWGWLFNPLTLFYCFDPSGRHVEWTVLEVSNTPWHERHAYVVGPPGVHTFAKSLHVSPFPPAEATYTLRYSAPEEGIRVRLDVAAQPPASPTAGRTIRALTPWLPGCRPPCSCGAPARSGRVGPVAVGVPADDHPGIERHLRAGRAPRGARARRSTGTPLGGRGVDTPRRGDGGQRLQEPTMNPTSASVLLNLARHAARQRPGTLRFEGSGVSGPKPIVTGSG